MHWDKKQNQWKQAFAKMFANFSRDFHKCFEVFASFFKFSDLLGPVRTCSDALGCVRMHSDASGCVRMRSDTFGKFPNFWTKKSIFFEAFASFLKFSDLLGPVRTHSDAAGCVRMRLYIFRI